MVVREERLEGEVEGGVIIDVRLVCLWCWFGLAWFVGYDDICCIWLSGIGVL